MQKLRGSLERYTLPGPIDPHAMPYEGINPEVTQEQFVASIEATRERARNE